MFALHPFSVSATGTRAHLRIMETTDLHVHVLPYDYFADRPNDSVGLARTAAHITAIRNEAANALLLDNGDFLQGNPMGDYIAQNPEFLNDATHPAITAMNTLGYDAGTLGNHEFNFGLDFLEKALSGATFPIVSANISRKLGASALQDQTLVKPYVMLDRVMQNLDGTRAPIRIGVLGLLPPQVVTWDHRHLRGNAQTRDIVETARAYIPQMLEEGADIIIAMCHSGIGATNWTEGMENAAIPLAALPGIDAVMLGHAHQVFPSVAFKGIPGVDAERGLIHGKPAVMAGHFGSHLGVVDLLLDHDGGKWRAITGQAEVRPIAQRVGGIDVRPTVASDKRITAGVATPHARTLEYIRAPVGHTTGPLHSFFALVGGDPTLNLIADAQRWHLTKQLEGTEHEDLPILSAASPFKFGGRAGPEYFTNVETGDLALRNIADLYLFPNEFRAVRLTGAEIREWLERAAGLFTTLVPDMPAQPLHDPDFPGHYFKVIDGLIYGIDPTVPPRYCQNGVLIDPARSRISNLCVDGVPVRDNQEFIVATNSFRTSGGGQFPRADQAAVIQAGNQTSREVLLSYVRAHGTITPRHDCPWHFAAPFEVAATFRSSPLAPPHLPSLCDRQVVHIGQDIDGFALFRITL